MQERVKRLLVISSDETLRKVLTFCFDGWGYEVFLHDAPFDDIAYVKKVSTDAIVIDVYSARKENLAICALLKEDLITAFIPVITLIDKRQLREQLLHSKHGVDDYLIKPPDPLDLRVRIEMAVKRAQYNYCTAPLTGLPGGRLIEEAIAERISRKAPFSFGYIDIDNFKYFNDVYGYLKGDRVIMQTAYILYTTVRRFGAKDDFIGHVGGDDFVFITGIDASEKICQNFICMFDTVIPFHYTAADRRRGFIVARDRNRKIRRAALVSVSIALVNRNSPAEFASVVKINEKIAEIKGYLKEIPGSKFMADRRDQAVRESRDARVYQKKETIASTYLPLGQILIERNMISPEQLDEALKVHWHRDVPLGSTLQELGMATGDAVHAALAVQRERLSPLFES
ncbi:MAG: diguanylate cyclase [Candidatus Omnitrophica bacterium]|nr:diguanylate cyclase [Candidatus Omnitrophota bacterium]